MHRIALFGGTFDPIHNGHIQTSRAIQSHFHFDNFYFVPCKSPTLKTHALATPEQRVEMLRLAINHTDFAIDLREIERNTPSFMVETLSSYRGENENASITLILGYDAFISLPHWHQWKKIIKLANLLIINRSLGIPQNNEEINELLKMHQSSDEKKLLNAESGAIYFFDAGNYDISSTQIREKLKKQQDISHEIPEAVYQYIKEQGLYQ